MKKYNAQFTQKQSYRPGWIDVVLHFAKKLDQ